jgi:hypothetical protein
MYRIFCSSSSRTGSLALGNRPLRRDILSEDDDPPGVFQPVEQQGEEPEYAAVDVAHVSVIFVALLNSCLGRQIGVVYPTTCTRSPTLTDF